MISKEELERIKQGDGLVVESNGIKHYGASEVLINGHRLTEVLEAAAAYKEEQPKVLDADGIEIKPGDKLYYIAETPLSGEMRVIESVHTEENPYKDGKPWVRFKNGGWNYAEVLTHQKPDTLQDVIDDYDKGVTEYWKCSSIPCPMCPSKIDGKTPHNYYGTTGCDLAKVHDIKRRLEAIQERMGGDGESKADEPVEIPERKTCPHCGSSHVITTKVITIGGGKRSEAETDLCLTCGRDLVGDSNE